MKTAPIATLLAAAALGAAHVLHQSSSGDLTLLQESAILKAADRLEVAKGHGVAVSANHKKLQEIDPNHPDDVVSDTDLSDFDEDAKRDVVGFGGTGSRGFTAFRPRTDAVYSPETAGGSPNTQCPDNARPCKTDKDCKDDSTLHYQLGRVKVYCHTCTIKDGKCKAA
ncbi:Uu.00g140310.m01.CDS01 [Anthostomella pinea]|uniref:Uu.00g140310.m01.CDS01 n=1 Tax=Anthostomella pinea TaxID=933095 RepID=A0AAI8YLH8_9PEZI|nr:Uu.00g140310.m01.CDS01 [Anthostomella pinea]